MKKATVVNKIVYTGTILGFISSVAIQQSVFIGHQNEHSLTKSCTISEDWEFGRRKGSTSKHDHHMLENQAESSIYEAISLISIDDSSIKLKRNEEPKKLYLHLARD